MAIKAGLVGVNPKGVDKNGMPIGSGGANVEAEIQQINLDIAQLQASKVGIGQLTANNKTFNFAYDSTTEKYGYKLDGTGDFIPFESAGGGPGWVKPADLVTTGLSYGNCEYVEGGYVIDGGNVYFDILVLGSTNGACSVDGLPPCDKSGLRFDAAFLQDISEKNDYYSTGSENCLLNLFSDRTKLYSYATRAAYWHAWGKYPVKN